MDENSHNRGREEGPSAAVRVAAARVRAALGIALGASLEGGLPGWCTRNAAEACRRCTRLRSIRGAARLAAATVIGFDALARARASACTILHEWLSQPRAHHGYDLDPAARRCIAPWRGPRVARNSALVKNSPPAGKRNREIEISASAMLVPLFFFPPLSLSPVLSLSFYYGRCCKRLWPYASCVTSFKTTNAGYFFFLTRVWHGVAKAYEFQLWNSSFFFFLWGRTVDDCPRLKSW